MILLFIVDGVRRGRGRNFYREVKYCFIYWRLLTTATTIIAHRQDAAPSSDSPRKAHESINYALTIRCSGEDIHHAHLMAKRHIFTGSCGTPKVFINFPSAAAITATHRSFSPAHSCLRLLRLLAVRRRTRGNPYIIRLQHFIGNL